MEVKLLELDKEIDNEIQRHNENISRLENEKEKVVKDLFEDPSIVYTIYNKYPKFVTGKYGCINSPITILEFKRPHYCINTSDTFGSIWNDISKQFKSLNQFKSPLSGHIKFTEDEKNALEKFFMYPKHTTITKRELSK